MTFEKTNPAQLSQRPFRQSLVIGISLLILSTSNPSFALTFQAESVEQLLTKARGMLQKKKFGDARKQLRKALQLDKNSFDANALMSFAFREENDRKEAIKYAYEALRIDSRHADLHYFLAVLLYETTESGQAKIELEKALSLGVDFANAYILKGDLEIEDRNFRPALEAYNKALKLLPETSVDKRRIQEKVESLSNYLGFADKKTTSTTAITKPKPLNFPRPNYNEDARRNGIEGVVKVRALVNEAGRIQSVLLINRLGYGLDEETIKTVLMMKFSPAKVGNQPVLYWVVLEVIFEL